MVESACGRRGGFHTLCCPTVIFFLKKINLVHCVNPAKYDFSKYSIMCSKNLLYELVCAAITLCY